MTVQSETTKARIVPRNAGSTARRNPTVPTESQLLEDVATLLPAGEARFSACAPGRFDVMGGSADYAGSLVVGMPMAHRACVAVQRRSDAKLTIIGAPTGGRRHGAPPDTNIPMTALNGSAGPSAGRAASLLGRRPNES